MCVDSILTRHCFKELNKLDAELSSLDSGYLTFQDGGFRDFQINNLLPFLPLKKRETEKTALNGWPSLTNSSFMRIYMKNS